MKKFYTLVLAALSFSAYAQTSTPYSQTFDEVPPADWIRGMGGDYTTGPETTTYSNWTKNAFLNDYSHNEPSLSIDFYTSERIDWIITPSFDLSEGGYMMSYDRGATYTWGTTSPSSTALDDKLAILYSTDGGTTWTELKSWVAPNTVFTPESVNESIDLSSITGSDVKFAFYANEGTEIDFSVDYRVFFDNFKIEKENLSASETGNKIAKLYPNPTNGKVFTDATKTVKSTQVYNTSGQLVSNGNSIDLTGKPAGAYTVKVWYTDGSVSTDKVIKK